MKVWRRVALIAGGLLLIGFVMVNANPYHGHGDMRRFEWVIAASIVLAAGVLGLLVSAIVLLVRKLSANKGPAGKR